MIDKARLQNELINISYIYEDINIRYPNLYTMNSATYYFHANGIYVAPAEKYEALESLYLQTKELLEGILKDEN